MARIRSIKPEITQSESMGRISRDARLCFINMWTVADDAGRLRGNGRMLASILFPYDDDAPSLIAGWLDELQREGCIALYEVGGNHYIEVCNWSKHQKVDKPTPSRLPSFASVREASESSRESSRDSREASESVREESRPSREDSSWERERERRGEEGRREDQDQVPRIERKDRSAGEKPRERSPEPVDLSTLKISDDEEAAKEPPDELGGDSDRPPLADLSGLDWDGVTIQAEILGKHIPPLSDEDRRQWLKYCVLARTHYSSDWIHDAIEGVRLSKETRKSRQAKFVAILKDNAAKMFGDSEEQFRVKRRSIDIPLEIWNSGVLPVEAKRA